MIQNYTFGSQIKNINIYNVTAENSAAQYIIIKKMIIILILLVD
jgi:hypothetical protein